MAKKKGGVGEEALFHKWLIFQGWQNIERARATLRRTGAGPKDFMSTRNDIFGVFDFLCADPGKVVHAYQITTESCARARKTKIGKKKFPWDWEQTVVYKRTGPRWAYWMMQSRTEGQKQWGPLRPVEFKRKEVEAIRLKDHK